MYESDWLMFYLKVIQIANLQMQFYAAQTGAKIYSVYGNHDVNYRIRPLCKYLVKSN